MIRLQESARFCLTGGLATVSLVLARSAAVLVLIKRPLEVGE